jgi:hypothetical protein
MDHATATKVNYYDLTPGDIVLYQNKRFIFERAKQKNVLAIELDTEAKYNLRIPPGGEFILVGHTEIQVVEVKIVGNPITAGDVPIDGFFVMARNKISELFQKVESRRTKIVAVSPMTGDRFNMPMSMEVVMASDIVG